MGTTLLVTAIALALGIVLGSVVALVRVAHDQQRPGRRNPVLGFFNAVCQVYTTIIRGTPMMVKTNDRNVLGKLHRKGHTHIAEAHQSQLFLPGN